jgi:transcriptional regulator with XRE-family HTH domain
VENVREIVARNLRLARQRAGVSQEALAEMAGIDRTYVSGIERGVRNPSIEVLAKFAHALGVSTASLLASPGGLIGRTERG